VPETKPPYPPEFRREAVRLVQSAAKPLPVIAAELGVSPQSLRNWVKLKAPPTPDLVERNFRAGRPNALWLADISYVPTLEGYLFLGVVMDMYSRKIVGWSMRDDLKADLVVDALAMAVTRRRPPAGLVHHSDRGSQAGLNRSSQRRFVDLTVNTHQMLRPASASQAFCGAGY
jgi:transposase InsO family protein